MDTKRVTWTAAIWSALSFVLCVAYGVISPEGFHSAALLEQILPGFHWITVQGFLIGLVESFLYGVYGGLSFSCIYNLVHRERGVKHHSPRT